MLLWSPMPWGGDHADGPVHVSADIHGQDCSTGQEEVRTPWPMSRKRPLRKRWRNATLIDLAATEMRPLMDLRMKGAFHAVEVTRAPPAATATEAAPNVVPMVPR